MNYPGLTRAVNGWHLPVRGEWMCLGWTPLIPCASSHRSNLSLALFVVDSMLPWEEHKSASLRGSGLGWSDRFTDNPACWKREWRAAHRAAALQVNIASKQHEVSAQDETCSRSSERQPRLFGETAGRWPRSHLIWSGNGRGSLCNNSPWGRALE